MELNSEKCLIHALSWRAPARAESQSIDLSLSAALLVHAHIHRHRYTTRIPASRQCVAASQTDAYTQSHPLLFFHSLSLPLFSSVREKGGIPVIRSWDATEPRGEQPSEREKWEEGISTHAFEKGEGGRGASGGTPHGVGCAAHGDTRAIYIPGDLWAPLAGCCCRCSNGCVCTHVYIYVYICASTGAPCRDARCSPAGVTRAIRAISRASANKKPAGEKMKIKGVCEREGEQRFDLNRERASWEAL